MLKIQNALVMELLVAGKEFKALKNTIPVFIRLAWDKNETQLQKHYVNIEKGRMAICEEYADKDDAGIPLLTNAKEYQISAENMKLVTEKIKKLGQEEVEIPDFRLDAKDVPKDFSFSIADFPRHELFMKFMFKN